MLSKETSEVTVIRGQRRIVKTPVEEIVISGVPVPVSQLQVDSDLLPVSLGLIVSVQRRLRLARVRPE